MIRFVIRFDLNQKIQKGQAVSALAFSILHISFDQIAGSKEGNAPGNSNRLGVLRRNCTPTLLEFLRLLTQIAGNQS